MRDEDIKYIHELEERVQELEEFKRSAEQLYKNYHISAKKSVAEKEELREQNKRYREAMQNTRSELAFITLLRPDMDTEKKINTAKRIINFALEGD